MTQLETDRLLLRQFTMDDVDDYHRAVFGDADAMKYMPGGKPLPKETTERWTTSHIEHWEKHGYGTWAAIHKADNVLLGHCGLNWLPETDEVEVHYAFDKRYWRQGLATEGARASVWYGFERLKLDKIVGLAFAENTGSRRVLEKCGLTYRKMAQYFGFELAYYTLVRADFEPGDEVYVVRE